MSGIIGGAGSKSGVIGETELDYEEGEWTLGTGNMTAVSAAFSCNYVKIGQLVTVNVKQTSGTLEWGSAGGYLTGLPFTPILGATGIMSDGSPTQETGLCLAAGSNLYLSGSYAADNVHFSVTYLHG